MYSAKILDIFKNPSNAGGLQGAGGIGKYVDESCGDFVKIYLKIDEDQEIIEARFKTMGSVGSIVASSVICELVTGLSIAKAQELTAKDILEITGEYPVDKMYSLDFAIRALNLAIADYYQRLEKEGTKGKKVTAEKPKKQSQAKKVETNEPVSFDLETEETNQEDEEVVELREELQEEFNEPEKEVDPFTAFAEAVESAENDENENLDPVDLFLRSMDDMEVKNMANGDAVSITTIQDAKEDPKATKRLEDAKSFTPVVETKILSDEDLKKLEANKKSADGDKQVSSAKALFDAMFEE